MKKKWLALIPAVMLVAVQLPYQTADAASENEAIQLSKSEIPPGYEAILNWPPEEQPIVKQGSQSFEAEFIQVMLNHFGLETGVDGVFGPHTNEKVRQLQAVNGLVPDGIVGVDTWTILLDEYEAGLFTVESAVAYAEAALDNDDLVFSSNGVLHEDSDGSVFYSLKAQSQDFIDDGGTGTVRFYDVYQNGDVVESEPR
ncbi:peptidoglycan-binding domain-containing protein [Oceanobacillus polygoni]|uniref:Peptidoglycan hydrolase-like protein with peptidoglycan-binding domain n=1 Tax=Oceanobacillus polygoni TaxID=1235259 RepID=A0A9X0YT71_9BACI|nr:peptidoglycan-binding domain-containing protein [Oceanobacillus polygoni]MBP2076865.1 peptidoglycan hydrolase-like protein with peptidoglycan-binding domain [Oceanobacillus polygoni]